ncbi:hypothetical protein [Streptomyces scopuliridis]|uniref:hypothetical protein n=1 Tax=Streptomyces scopuliridis TaxID=452529 RepID=UPI00342AD01B
MDNMGNGLVPGIETYLADQSALLERCHQRLLGYSSMWWGASGTALTGDQIAAHADAADRYLAAPNAWLPHATTEERAALYMAEHGVDVWDVPFLLDRRDLRTALIATQPSEDTRYVLQRILSNLIAASTGAPYALHDVWDLAPGRTLAEVRAMLCAAAAYARRYGPVDAARPAA